MKLRESFFNYTALFTPLTKQRSQHVRKAKFQLETIRSSGNMLSMSLSSGSWHDRFEFSKLVKVVASLPAALGSILGTPEIY